MAPAKQTWVLAAICLADLVSTMTLVSHMEAAEANPLMGFFLAQGVTAFVGAKVLLSAGPLALIEWTRTRRPRLAERALNLTIVLYIGLYGLGVYRANSVRAPWDYPPNANFFDADPKAAELFAQTQRNIERKRQAALYTQTTQAAPRPAGISARPETAIPVPVQAMPIALID